MKTKAILYLLAVLLLSSCAGKFGVMKRRYNKGYYVTRISSDKNGKQRNGETKTARGGNSGSVMKKQLVTDGLSDKDPDYTPVARSAAEHPEKKKIRITEKKVLANAATVEYSSQPAVRAELRPLPAETGVVSLPLQDDDTMKILLVILAIFIPPLAVYLKDNAVSKWFWITLILALLGIFGFWFLFYTGFFWLAAVVIAILYVLDLIG